ncbi:MAG: aminotransferase class I/II-fold pyridoxal phosphate-dependent enzyme [Anaerolineaceae bacterium]|nr:aminotransferase class I/II-fold pyridoxal phosphate-dependent enzyme [Anaerolineaceae bacterium]
MTEKFIPFEMERRQSLWENLVEYNITESGVHPMTIRELIEDPEMIEELLDLELNYPQTNGTIELRESIASMYPGATQDNVHVTIGCAQANFTALMTVLQPGDEIALMLPNYMQIWGIGQNFGFPINTFTLKEELGWGLDIDELNKAVTEKTKLIAVCNPNNPTGHILTEDEMDAVVDCAQRSGAWILADEVYAGAERLTDQVTPSFWGRSEKVLAMGSTSKAYGLPGLRVGWAVSPVEISEALWSRQDYITISATMLANKLAAYALSPEVRPRILKRTREYIRRGYNNFERWAEDQGDMISFVPSQAAAITFVRYHLDVNSTVLCDRVMRAKGVLVVPGDNFGIDQHLRISFGLPAVYLNESLDRLSQVMKLYK